LFTVYVQNSYTGLTEVALKLGVFIEKENPSSVIAFEQFEKIG